MKVEIDPKEILGLLDEVDDLIRFASVKAPRERYLAAATAFWAVAHLVAGNSKEARALQAKLPELTAERDAFLTRERHPNGSSERPPTAA